MCVSAKKFSLWLWLFKDDTILKRLTLAQISSFYLYFEIKFKQFSTLSDVTSMLQRES